MYIRASTLPGLEPTWHRLVALAGSSTNAYPRCRPAIAFQADAMAKLEPEGRHCRECGYVEPMALPVPGRRREVIRIEEDVYREVDTGLLLETNRRDGGEPYVWRTRPEYIWWGIR